MLAVPSVRCVGSGADIADFRGDADWQFALHVERELLDVGRPRVRVDQREALADAGRAPRVLPTGCKMPVGKRIGEVEAGVWLLSVEAM